MDYVGMARLLRKMIEDVASGYTDDEASAVPFAYPRWNVGVEYTTGDRIRYGQYLYKVMSSHTSQIEWLPGTAPSLYSRILPGQDGSIGEWVQPDGTNPYMIGDRVIHNGKIWVSTVDNNVWEPGLYGWEEIGPSGEDEPDPDEIPEWVQPDAMNPYMTGDKVTHNGKTWISIVDNNVWEPGVYGWEEVTEEPDEPEPEPDPDEPTDEIPAWAQPDGTNPYMTGDKVTHNGKTWISVVDNNVWEPGVYGWEEIE